MERLADQLLRQEPAAGRRGGAGRGESFRKDANEVLMKDGPEVLRQYVEEADAYPIRGLLRCVMRTRTPFGGCSGA